MKEQIFVSAVAYVHNDENTVGDFLKVIDEIMDNTFESYEIILVNDFSTDRTLETARAAIKLVNGNVKILDLSRKHGVELGMLAGLDKSVGDFVFEFESTVIDYPTSIIPEMYKTAAKGYDIVSASSNKKPGLNSKLFYWVINKMSQLNLSLSTESIKLVTRRALNSKLNLKEKVRYRKALYAFTGYPSTKIEYEPLPNVKRPSKKLNRENISLAMDVIVSFSDFGLKLAHYIAVVFFAFSIFMIGYSLYNYIFNQNVIEGWTTIMILTATGFAGIFFILGMLGEYIGRILIEVQNRPSYTLRTVEVYKEKDDFEKIKTVQPFVAATKDE